MDLVRHALSIHVTVTVVTMALRSTGVQRTSKLYYGYGAHLHLTTLPWNLEANTKEHRLCSPRSMQACSTLVIFTRARKQAG